MLKVTTCSLLSVLLPIVLVAELASEMTSWLTEGLLLQYVCLYQPRSLPDEEETGPRTAWVP